MSDLHPGHPRLRLPPEQYAALCKRVLVRDGWRCQECGPLQDLQVHHLKARSKLGEDVLQNLITLCRRCHRHVMDGKPI